MKDNGYVPAQLPLTHAVMQMEGGSENWTQSEIERALFYIDKPLQRITLHDVRVVIEKIRQEETLPNETTHIS